jgi:hypothetical protein
MSTLDPETATRQELEAALRQWRDLRESRLAQDKISAKLKEQEDAARENIIATMQHQLYDGVVIGERVMGLSTKQISIVDDAPTLTQWILDTGNLAVLQFRLSESTIAEMESAGETIPGVGKMEKFNLYDRKL